MRIEEVRSDLTARLRNRRPEIEAAIFARVQAVSEQEAGSDPEYAHGLRATVAAAVEFGLGALERSEGQTLPIPIVALSQARIAAQTGIALDTVLRRYFAGYSLLSDYVIEEAVQAGVLRGSALQRLLRAQAALFDRLIVAVGEEYARAEGAGLVSSEQRRAERVRRLLAGEPLDTGDLAYEFEGHHLGAIGVGPRADEALSELARTLDRALLLVRREEGTVWAWLGGRRAVESEEALSALAENPSDQVVLALGESQPGLAGWRLTHRQARAALPIALREGKKLVRYADVAVLASMLRDELLVTSLQKLYLAPLEEDRGVGKTAKETLTAYFAADRHVSSAAAALGVSRRTVNNRLQAIERKLGRRLPSVAPALEAALRLDSLGGEYQHHRPGRSTS